MSGKFSSSEGFFGNENTTLDRIQTELDVIGWIPGIGDVADGANGLISLYRKDYVSAGLDLVSMVPLIGDVIGKGGKIGKKIIQHGDEVADIGKLLLKNSDEIASLSKEAGKVSDTVVSAKSAIPNQMHHFATNKNKLYTPKYEEILSKYGLGLDDGVNAPYGEWNKAMMPHKGRHPNEYHEFVLDQMMTASKEAGNSTELFIQKYNEYVVEPVMEHPEMLRKKYWRK